MAKSQRVRITDPAQAITMCPSGATITSNSSKKKQASPFSVSALAKASENSSTMATTSRSISGRRPSSLQMPSPSPLGHRRRNNNKNNNKDDEENKEACRFCGSYSLVVDWKQGDKVCTTCGVVAEERLLDDRPEWREFNDVDDIVKGAPAAARCGMIPVDESKYLGGLQPTTLAKQPFGGHTPGASSNGGSGNGSSAARVAMIRKRLQSTNRKLDRMMGQRHARALKDARVSRLVRKRQLMDGGGDITDTDLDSVVTAMDRGDDDDHVPPEIEQILIQEEEDANRMQAALNSDKWSLKRAILLFGDGISSSSSPGDLSERDDLEKRLDSKLRRASADLYQAYQMLLEAARRLQLPDRVIHEATDNLCRYVARRDGFPVKGVSSRLTLKKNNISALEKKRAAETLREHNKMKQMGSLCAALLLWTARKLGWPRPLPEVCGAVQPVSSSLSHQGSNTSKQQQQHTDASLIKPKHCGRAMEEIKTTLPDFARTVATANPSNNNAANNIHGSNLAEDPVSTINFVDHAVRKLRLPPVAEASIRALVWQCAQEQKATGQNSGTKLSTLCASLAYFICLSGSVMQQLASQAQAREKHKDTTRNRKTTRFVFNRRNNNSNNMGQPPPSKLPKLIHVKEETRVVSTDSAIIGNGKDNSKTNSDDSGGNHDDNGIENDDDDDEFDVFSHKVGKQLLKQKKEYEMRRVWDTWAEQTAWLRSLAEIENSSGVSSQTILSHYKANIYPRRQTLLESLRDAVTISAPNSATTITAAAVDGAGAGGATTTNTEPSTNMLTETPLASVLLSHVVAAAPLLNPSGKLLTFGSSR